MVKDSKIGLRLESPTRREVYREFDRDGDHIITPEEADDFTNIELKLLLRANFDNEGAIDLFVHLPPNRLASIFTDKVVTQRDSIDPYFIPYWRALGKNPKLVASVIDLILTEEKPEEGPHIADRFLLETYTPISEWRGIFREFDLKHRAYVNNRVSLEYRANQPFSIDGDRNKRLIFPELNRLREERNSLEDDTAQFILVSALLLEESRCPEHEITTNYLMHEVDPEVRGLIIATMGVLQLQNVLGSESNKTFVHFLNHQATLDPKGLLSALQAAAQVNPSMFEKLAPILDQALTEEGKRALRESQGPYSIEGIPFVTGATFEREVIQSPQAVLVIFGASWCGICLKNKPYFQQKASESRDKIRVVTIDADQAPELMQKFAVEGVPTAILFQFGKERGRMTGFNSLKLDTLLKPILSADPNPL